MFHLWENVRHCRFKGNAANILSIFGLSAGIQDFLLNWGRESVVGRGVPGGGRGEERREGKKKKAQPGLGLENEDLFLFQMCFRPSGPCFGLDAENLRGDP